MPVALGSGWWRGRVVVAELAYEPLSHQALHYWCLRTCNDSVEWSLQQWMCCLRMTCSTQQQLNRQQDWQLGRRLQAAEVLPRTPCAEKCHVAALYALLHHGMHQLTILQHLT